jgi:cytochrome b involved in lipid metabolism
MYKLLRIYGIKNEKNTNRVESAKYDVIQKFETFDIDKETEKNLIEICKKKNVPYSAYGNYYLIVKYIDEVPVMVEGRLSYNNPNDKDFESYLDYAEWNFRVYASVALNKDLTIGTEYKLTSNITDEAYTPWIESFVKNIIYKASIDCSNVVITDIEPSKRIFLLIDGKEYDIRTWSYKPLDKDKKGNVFSETVVYTLYKIIPDKDGSHGEDIIDGQYNIYWDVK